MKMVLDIELQSMLFLNSLQHYWETLVMSLRNSAPNNVTMSMNEEIRRKALGTLSSEKLVTENRSQSRPLQGRDKS